jgi:protocatechuate 3,4-dioxygenase beta subunit
MRSVTGAALLALALYVQADPQREPLAGGPCEDCENAFVDLPAEPGTDARIAPPGEPGAPLVITGTVRTREGTPVPGIIVYAYHTNAAGIYPRGRTRHGALRGWARTDERGEYRFTTIRPGAYPGDAIPQHVHMQVIEPGRAHYWIDDVLFSDDPLLTAERRRALTDRGGNGVCDPSRDDDGVWHVRRDIVLGLNIPGYPAS